MSYDDEDPLAGHKWILKDKRFLKIANSLFIRGMPIIDKKSISEFSEAFGRQIKGGEQVLMEREARHLLISSGKYL